MWIVSFDPENNLVRVAVIPTLLVRKQSSMAFMAEPGFQSREFDPHLLHLTTILF